MAIKSIDHYIRHIFNENVKKWVFLKHIFKYGNIIFLTLSFYFRIVQVFTLRGWSTAWTIGLGENKVSYWFRAQRMDRSTARTVGSGFVATKFLNNIFC